MWIGKDLPFFTWSPSSVSLGSVVSTSVYLTSYKVERFQWAWNITTALSRRAVCGVRWALHLSLMHLDLFSYFSWLQAAAFWLLTGEEWARHSQLSHAKTGAALDLPNPFPQRHRQSSSSGRWGNRHLALRQVLKPDLAKVRPALSDHERA